MVNCMFDPQRFYGDASARLRDPSALRRVARLAADPKCSERDQRDSTLRVCARAFGSLELRGRYYAKLLEVSVQLDSRPGAPKIPPVRVPMFRLVVDLPCRTDGLNPGHRQDDVLRVVCTPLHSVSSYASALFLRRCDGTLSDNWVPISCRSTILHSWSLKCASWGSDST